MKEISSETELAGLANGRWRSPRRSKTAMVVAQQLVEEISTHGYAPGTKLEPEKEMLLKYGVGRGTLRESLRFLEMNGVITVKPGPGGGPVVATPDAHDLASTLGLFLELQETTFGSILEVREVLEPAVAGLAASRQDAAVIEALGRSVESMARNVEDADHFLRENERFHHLVAAGAGNPVFVLLIGSLDYIADGSRVGVNFSLARRKAVVKAHQAIYEAVKSGDAAAAVLEMTRHVDAFRRYTDKRHPEAATTHLRWRDVAP